MRLRYKKTRKINYKGGQLKQGSIIEVSNLGNLPENWFEVLEEEKFERVSRKKAKSKVEEVMEDGDSKKSDKDLGS